MRSALKPAVPIVCLALVVVAPAAAAQAIPKSLVRLCFRNIVTGIGCYIVGRGGELIIDGSLSTAWAKAKETVTGEEPKDDKKQAEPRLERPLHDDPAPLGVGKRPTLFANQIVEPLNPTDLHSLSKRLPAEARKAKPTEGFLIYATPGTASQPPGLRDPSRALIPETGLSDILKPKPLFPEPARPKRLPSDTGDPFLDADFYRARNAKKPAPALPPLVFGSNGLELDTPDFKCQRRREGETGLSLLAILGRPDFEVRFQRRMEEVIKPCMAKRPF
jgi:hypothetical protein